MLAAAKLPITLMGYPAVRETKDAPASAAWGFFLGGVRSAGLALTDGRDGARNKSIASVLQFPSNRGLPHVYNVALGVGFPCRLTGSRVVRVYRHIRGKCRYRSDPILHIRRHLYSLAGFGFDRG
jgi:hypothetical protein